MSGIFVIGIYASVAFVVLVITFWYDKGDDEFSTVIGVFGCLLWPAVFFVSTVVTPIWVIYRLVKLIQKKIAPRQQE